MPKSVNRSAQKISTTWPACLAPPQVFIRDGLLLVFIDSNGGLDLGLRLKLPRVLPCRCRGWDTFDSLTASLSLSLSLSLSPRPLSMCPYSRTGWNGSQNRFRPEILVSLWFQPARFKYSILYSSRMNCFREPVSVRHLSWNKRKARGHDRWWLVSRVSKLNTTFPGGGGAAHLHSLQLIRRPWRLSTRLCECSLDSWT